MHKSIGHGLLESVYENALCYDLREFGLKVEQQTQCLLYIKELK